MPRRRSLLIVLLVIAACAALAFWYHRSHPPAARARFGATFSDKYAKELGVDWKAAFIASLDDLGIRRFRIPIYWDEVEAKRGTYDWSDTDWMLQEADARGAEVILAVGRKTPRWPECHAPAWVESLDETAQQERVLRFLGDEVRHFSSSRAVKVWQVENEPLFHFGKCPPPDREFLKKEISLVKGLDSRPVMVTDSGELSTWIRTGTLGDILGISMYRLVYNEYLGQLYWPVSPFYYTDRINLVSPVVRRVIVSELQAEPWFRKPVAETSLDEQFAQMDAARLRENADFASSTGASDVYFWGVEWWFWLKTQGHDELWQAARPFFS